MHRNSARFGLILALTALLAVCATGLTARTFEPALGVILTPAPQVTAHMRASLVREATRIWAQAGIHLSWAPPVAPSPPGFQTLRILAVPRPLGQAQSDITVMGELHRVDQAKAIAMVSLNEAERIVARLERAARPRSLDERIGVVLGRAAAHEIGHYLLDTSTHAAEGLMRPRFDELEFAEPETAAFDLDSLASAWIRRRLNEGLPLGPGARHDASVARQTSTTSTVATVR